MRLLAALLALATLTAALAGCAGAPPGMASLNGVSPSAAGSVTLTAADGLAILADAGNATVRVGLSNRVLAPGVLQACRGPCDEFSSLDGMVVAEGSLVSLNNLTLNARGPDRDGVAFFYDHGQANGQYLRWYDARGRFELSDDVEALGNLTARHHLGTITTVVLAGGQGLAEVATAAIEAAEPIVVVRGSGRLVSGVANLTLPSQFTVLVGEGAITAQVTPTARGAGLFVSEKAPGHLKVQTLDGSASDQTFDYLVQAVRSGSEDFQVVRAG